MSQRPARALSALREIGEIQEIDSLRPSVCLCLSILWVQAKSKSTIVLRFGRLTSIESLIPDYNPERFAVCAFAGSGILS